MGGGEGDFCYHNRGEGKDFLMSWGRGGGGEGREGGREGGGLLDVMLQQGEGGRQREKKGTTFFIGEDLEDF